jgi:MFS family permease
VSLVPSVRDILGRAAAASLTPETEARVREALERHAAGHTPWYIRLLVGLGAWLGSWFLLAFAFMFLALILEGEVDRAAIAMGVCLVGFGVWLRHVASGELLRQLSLVASFTGQMLVVGGVGASSESLSAAATTALVLSILLLVAFPERVHRFVSTIVATVALDVLLWEGRVPYANDLLTIALAAVPLVAWRLADAETRERFGEALDPIAYGAVVSLLGGLAIDAVMSALGVHSREWSGPGLPALVAVAAALGGLAVAVCAGHGVPPPAVTPLAAVAIVMAFAWVTRSTPALAVTLLIIVVGFDRRRPLLIGLATIFFLGFGALYYYNLQMTLLEKSGVLIGSGVLCLATSALLRWRGVSEAA